MQGCRLHRPGLVLVLRVRGAVSPHARRYPSPPGGRRTTPRQATARLRYPRSRCGWRCVLPAFRSAAWSVVPPLRAVTGPPLPSSHVQAFSPLATGLLMPRARGRARGMPSPPLAPSDSAPGWTPGLARCGRWAAPLVLVLSLASACRAPRTVSTVRLLVRHAQDRAQ